jgi:hypothetical protein
MTDETTAHSTAAAPEASRGDAKGGKSSYRAGATPIVAVDSRLNGGAGVQRSHLRNRKAWLKGRTRAGQTWAQRKASSLTYCPAKAQRGS